MILPGKRLWMLSFFVQQKHRSWLMFDQAKAGVFYKTYFMRQSIPAHGGLRH